jgi:UDP-3-O-[3-hydroxymyristoyl] N-acetylglucosamine deacetylase
VSGATIATATCLAGTDSLGRRQVSVRLGPAGPGTGIWFNRGERAVLSNASVVGHATCLGRGRRRVRMVEHLLAACSGLGITDLAVDVGGAELPIGDGSARPYMGLLSKAGVVRYKKGPDKVRLKRPVLVKENARFIAAVPASGLTINCLTTFPEFGPQFCSFALTTASFASNIAPARTMAMTRVAPAVLRRRLGLRFGLKRFGRFVCAERWRLGHEPCRHKALDLLGDLALLGRPFEAAVFACMPGHRLNLAFARRIEKELEAG